MGRQPSAASGVGRQVAVRTHGLGHDCTGDYGAEGEAEHHLLSEKKIKMKNNDDGSIIKQLAATCLRLVHRRPKILPVRTTPAWRIIMAHHHSRPGLTGIMLMPAWLADFSMMISKKMGRYT